MIVPPSEAPEPERTTKPPTSKATTAAAAINLPFLPLRFDMSSPFVLGTASLFHA
ncbi:unannotated protein [freshwater metagenome]|uniref:Unannotated protein n=1 Tax=freshwater metagenome TaxID=449393 RepID=A0A6J5Z5P9_9ZZZZ